jgi:ribose/xylose/arabinose/galactoside ABC-type transport system permease subunit
MYLQIGGAQVWSDGSIIYASGDNDHFMHLRSATFPVSVAWQYPVAIPCIVLLRKTRRYSRLPCWFQQCAAISSGD